MARQNSTRSGTILICVMTCLLVSMSLVASAIHMSLRSRHECRIAQQLLQTEFLVEAGVSRAIERLRRSPDYTGERWRLDAAITGLESAVVEIAIQPAAADKNNGGANSQQPVNAADSQITVIARIGPSTVSGAQSQRSHTFSMKLSQR